jgi:PAS domain-containing protein
MGERSYTTSTIPRTVFHCPKLPDWESLMEHGIVMASKDGRIVHWSEGASELFGYSEADVIGRPVDLIVPEDLRAKHWEGFHRAMGGGERQQPIRCSLNLLVAPLGGSVEAGHQAASMETAEVK